MNSKFILFLSIFLIQIHFSLQVRHQIMGTGILANILTKKLIDIGEVDIVQVNVLNTSSLIPNLLISSEKASIDSFVNKIIYGSVNANNINIRNANFEKSTHSVSLNLTHSDEYHFLDLNSIHVKNVEINTVKVNSRNNWYFRSSFDPSIYLFQQFCNSPVNNFEPNVQTDNYSVYYDEPGLSYCKSLQRSRIGYVYYPSKFYENDITLNQSYIFQRINEVNNWYPLPLFGNWSLGHDIIVAIDVINSTIDLFQENRNEGSPEIFIYIAISIILFISCLFLIVLLINVFVIRKKSEADIDKRAVEDG